MIVVLALLAAFVYGSGVVLQQRTAMEVGVEHAARPSLLLRLVRKPIWLIGLGADVGGFALQAAALHRGSLVIVQPLLTTALLFSLGFTVLFTRERIPASDWVAVVLVLTGLAVFLITSSPDEQSVALADARGWLICTAVIGSLTIVVVGAALRSEGAIRAGLFGLAAGVADAFMAVLAKTFSGSFDRGVSSVFHSWTPYALVAGGITALLLTSTAYQAGFPTVTLPIITVVDPIVGSLIGITLFNDHLRLGGVRGPLVFLALLVAVGGIILLTRDRRLAEQIAGQTSEDPEQPSSAPSQTATAPGGA
jgi:drug/metabolite transporter (DMT)-like permease